MDRLRNKKISNEKKKHRSKSEDESEDESATVSWQWLRLLGCPERVGY